MLYQNLWAFRFSLFLEGEGWGEGEILRISSLTC